MRFSSRTGLTPSAPRRFNKRIKADDVKLVPESRPAPFILKPLAGLYNPYRYGCSLLCNHPTNEDARELLKRAKDTWANESRRAILFEDEIAAIRDSLEQFKMHSKKETEPSVLEAVPEELFRRYTETDSRPLTPAPTISSAATRASGSRRCVTPDPISISVVKEKTMLVLDLRRSHSQEMICAGTSFLEPPLILIQHVPTRRGSLEEIGKKPKYMIHMPATARVTKTHEDTTKTEMSTNQLQENGDNEEFYVKRKGKKRRKQRNGSTALTVQPSTDPETQVGTFGVDSNNPSARPSLMPGSAEDAAIQKIKGEKEGEKCKSSQLENVDSYLDKDILKLLRRELTDEIYDNEFNWKRRAALAEALKTLSDGKDVCEDLVALQEQLNLPPINTDLWIDIPRVFSRTNARFELPPFSGMLPTMTPLDYINEYIDITTRRKMMYNSIFNKFKLAGSDRERKIEGKRIIDGLHLLMGQKMPIEPIESFKELVGWDDNAPYNFKTFSCICATCERLLASKYTRNLSDRTTDPCHELEAVDFESLNTKLETPKIDRRLVEILYGIKNL